MNSGTAPIMMAARNPAASAISPTDFPAPEAPSIPTAKISINMVPDSLRGRCSLKENIMGIIPEKNRPEKIKISSVRKGSVTLGAVRRQAEAQMERMTSRARGLFQKFRTAAQIYLPTVTEAQKSARISPGRKPV